MSEREVGRVGGREEKGRVEREYTKKKEKNIILYSFVIVLNTHTYTHPPTHVLFICVQHLYDLL